MFASCAIVLAAGCRKLPEFSPIPEIQEVRLQRSGNLIVLEMDFTDGDGNMGLATNQTAPPFNFVPDTFPNGELNTAFSVNMFYYNLFVDLMAKEDDAWQKVELALPIYFRMPDMTPTGQNKALEGTIRVNVQDFWPPASLGLDSIRFDCQITDRDLQLSNISSSPVAVIGEF